MAVDRNARDRLSELLRHFIAKQTTNFEFNDAAFVIKTNDAGVIAVREAIWFLYDDLHQHKLTGKWAIEENDRREVARWILFLKSDFEYEWPVVSRWRRFFRIGLILMTLGFGSRLWDRRYRQQGDKSLWPFLRLRDLEAAQQTPAYLLDGAG